MKGYERVQFAIVTQAIKDYKIALKRKNKAQISELEQWFLSAYGQALSGNNGEFIIKKCRECVGMKRKRKCVKNNLHSERKRNDRG